MAVSSNDAPLFSSAAVVPEMTIKAIVLAIILTIILAAANAFLILKVGLTVSASIPAAIISMGVLHLFKRSNALESNLVQTSASAGEAVAAGLMLSLPALVMLHYWAGFHYWETVSIGLIGGILGVLFTVPLRRVLLTEQSLRFPEGTAIGNILRVNAAKSGAGLKTLLSGSAVGGVIALLQTGFKVLGDTLQFWTVRGNVVFGLGCGFSPALLGAGYIIGINAAGTILIGVVLAWVVGVPVLSLIYGLPAGVTDPSQIAWVLWKSQIRYIGVGTMMVGGIYAIIGLLKPIYIGIKASIAATSQLEVGAVIPRIERDIPLKTVLYLIIGISIPAYFLLAHFGVTDAALPISLSSGWLMAFFCLIFVIIAGFFFSAVCAYFAGLIGSSSSPISSMALMALILGSLLIIFWLGSSLDFNAKSAQTLACAGLAIIITTVICSAAAISCEIMQDLKAGHMVGATPWKQQLMMIIGVVVTALTLPFIIDLLFNAYGIGGVLPHPGMDPNQSLLAPGAGLMATVAEGLFTHQFNATMLAVGMVFGLIALLLNPFLHKKGFSIPILPLGLGIYLPISTMTPLVIGGFLSYYVKRAMDKCVKNDESELRAEKEQNVHQTGMLISCGLIAGASIMAVLLAIPFGIKGSADVLRLIPERYDTLAEWLSAVVTVIVIMWFKKRTLKEAK